MTTSAPNVSCVVIVDKLTSSIYNASNPPKDWADLSFLIPHEAMRRDMNAMLASVAALGDGEPWKSTLFCRYYVEYFCVNVHDHHENEEVIYFPWIATKAAIPSLKGKSHKELLEEMEEIQMLAEMIIAKEGIGCEEQIHAIQSKFPLFVADMKEHLGQEELLIPPILRAHFTVEEEKPVIGKILQAGGLKEARNFFPAIFLAMDEWASPDFLSQFMDDVPPPIRHLMVKYYIPDYLTYVIPMRDAPTLSREPKLTKVPCFGLFCCPCIL